MLRAVEAGTGNTSSTAPTAKVLRLPGRAARGAPRGGDRAPEGGEGLALVRAAYEAAGGSCAQPVGMRPLARRLGLAPRAVEHLAMRLQAERLVRVVSMAKGLLRLTPEGARAAERANGRVAEGAASDPSASDPSASAGSGPPGPAVPTAAPLTGGGLAGRRAAPAASVLGPGGLRELEGMLGPLKAGLDRLDLDGALDEEQRSELAAEVRTIEAQLGSPRPKRGIVVAALESVRGVVGSATGCAESGRISRAIDAFLGGAGSTGRAARGVAGAAGEDGSGARRPEEEDGAAVRSREAGGVRVRKRPRDGGARDTERAAELAAERARGADRTVDEGANGAIGEAGKGAGAGRRVLRAVDEAGDKGGMGAVSGPRVGGKQSAERSATGKAVRVPLVQDLMTSDVATIGSSAGVVEAAKTMIAEGKGPLPVMEGNRPVAMVTDRDLVAYVVAQGLDPNVVTVEDVQTSPLVTIESDRDAEEARRLMDEHGLDRLVVVDDGELAGIVSEADLRSDEGPPL